MCYVFKVSVNVYNKKTNQKNPIKIKGFFVWFVFHTWVLRDFSFLPGSTVQRILGECDASIPHSVHTQKSSGMNKAMFPAGTRQSLSANTSHRPGVDETGAGRREAAAQECFIQAFSISAVQMSEPALSWLCFTCFLG